MKPFRWNALKNKFIKQQRGASFEEIIASKFITAIDHPKRLNQIVLLFEYKEYIWFVACVEHSDYFFIKTAFPSSKYTQQYRRGMYEKN